MSDSPNTPLRLREKGIINKLYNNLLIKASRVKHLKVIRHGKKCRINGLFCRIAMIVCRMVEQNKK